MFLATYIAGLLTAIALTIALERYCPCYRTVRRVIRHARIRRPRFAPLALAIGVAIALHLIPLAILIARHGG